MRHRHLAQALRVSHPPCLPVESLIEGVSFLPGHDPEMNLMQDMQSSKIFRLRVIPAVTLAFLLASIPLSLMSDSPAAQTIAVRHLEGLVHGFLALRTLEGETVANGELTQSTLGDRVTNHLIFRFKDGSMHEESTVFSQRRNFRLLSYRLVQKGPAFKHPIDVTINGLSGQVTVRYMDDQGKENVLTEHVESAASLANGVVVTLIKNIAPNVPRTTFPFLVTTPKPRLVKLEITTQGEDTFSIGETTRKVTHYVAKVQIGGVAGVVAPLVGKQPPDTQVWILGGDAPTLVKSEGPLFEGGPLWRIELVSPVGPKVSSENGGPPS